MNFFVFAFAVIAIASATSIGTDYLPPATKISLPTQEYLPSAKNEEAVAQDTINIPSSGYLFPQSKKEFIVQDILGKNTIEDLAVDEEVDTKEKTVLTNDGYRYRTIRRLIHRHRRDVSELISTNYLSNALQLREEIADESVPILDVPIFDGYRYKTIRRLRRRKRRDVNELPLKQYLPATEEYQPEVDGEYDREAVSDDVTLEDTAVPKTLVVEPANSSIADDSSDETAILTNDGYRYKTVRRTSNHRQSDIIELPSSQYLPIAAESYGQVKVNDVPILTKTSPEADTVLTDDDDGYRYKTVRRLKYRQRRDVNQLNNKYLPVTTESKKHIPTKHKLKAHTVSNSHNTAVLANDGYRYKTVRRIRYRYRRDVNELPHNDYLPPPKVEHDLDVAIEPVVETFVLPESKIVNDHTTADNSAVLANDGYRYKSAQRLRYRYRRDVNELPVYNNLPSPANSKKEIVVENMPENVVNDLTSSNQYLPPVSQSIEEEEHSNVHEAPLNNYLPPVPESIQQVPLEKNELPFKGNSPSVSHITETIPEISVPQEKTILAKDGYRYKSVRRLKYRQRRDVSELLSRKYLPTALDTTSTQFVESPIEESIILPGSNGYLYNTVRRLRYRLH